MQSENSHLIPFLVSYNMTWLDGKPRMELQISWPSDDSDILDAIQKIDTPARLEWQSTLYDDRLVFYASPDTESKTLVYVADFSSSKDQAIYFQRLCILPFVVHRLSMMSNGDGFSTAHFDRT